jgi:hypothetical protein
VITSDVLTSAIDLEHAPQDFMIVISLLAMKLLLRWMGKSILGMSDHTRLKINRLRTLISNGIAIRERSPFGQLSSEVVKLSDHTFLKETRMGIHT